jgi:hypothetical protein
LFKVFGDLLLSNAVANSEHADMQYTTLPEGKDILHVACTPHSRCFTLTRGLLCFQPAVLFSLL